MCVAGGASASWEPTGLISLRHAQLIILKTNNKNLISNKCHLDETPIRNKTKRVHVVNEHIRIPSKYKGMSSFIFKMPRGTYSECCHI